MSKIEKYYKQVKCPDCEWSQFQSGEAVGMSPCYNCNSTGYTYEPVEQNELQPDAAIEEITELKEQVDYMHEAHEVLVEFLEDECQKKIDEIWERIESKMHRVAHLLPGDAYADFHDESLRMDSVCLRMLPSEWQSLKELGEG